MSVNTKYITFSTDDSVELFKAFNGYYNLVNEDLARFLIKLDLIEEKNRVEEKNIYSFIKWSFTTSFLFMLNAWQWFFSGIMLGRSMYVPAQVMQMYYYSIFFAYRSFLAFHFKGNYTIKIVKHASNPRYEQKTRMDVWVADTPCIALENPSGRGGEHERTAFWYYKIFNHWELKNDYPDVRTFINDEKWHVKMRNMYTYSLSDIAEELYCAPECKRPVSAKILLDLWNRSGEWVDYFPEEFWSLEHLKVVMDLHLRLLDSYDKISSPYTEEQARLLLTLYNHHRDSDLKVFIAKIFKQMFVKCNIGLA